MADIYSLTIRADTTDVTRARQALAGLSDGSIRAQRATADLTRVAVRSGRQFKVNNQLIQQAGFQVGDFATQIASGGNALVAFTQQFGQLAGFIGPAGPIIGAIVAIGGAVAIGLTNAFGQGEVAAENLAEKMRELATQLGTVNDRQRQIINTGFAQTIAEQTRVIEEQRQSIFEANRIAQNFFENQTRAGVPASVIESSEAWKNLIGPVEEARNQIALAEATIAATRKEQTEFWQEIDKSSESADDSAEQQRRLREELRRQAEALKIARIEVNEYWKAWDAVQKVQDKIDPIGADLRQFGEDIAIIQDAFSRGIITAEQADEMVNRLNQVGEAAQTTDQGLQMFTQSQQNMLGIVSGIFGNMAEIAEKGGKDQFDTWKTMASAQAAVNTALAISNALATPPAPLGIALAGTIGVLGAAQIAQIQATEYQGARALGGSVSAGGTYMVGEDGPEPVTFGQGGVVTPSSVMDKMWGGKDGDVIVNIQNAPQGTRTESRTDDQGNRFVDVFIGDMASGGPMSRALQSTYGMRRQGR